MVYLTSEYHLHLVQPLLYPPSVWESSISSRFSSSSFITPTPFTSGASDYLDDNLNAKAILRKRKNDIFLLFPDSYSRLRLQNSILLRLSLKRSFWWILQKKNVKVLTRQHRWSSAEQPLTRSDTKSPATATSRCPTEFLTSVYLLRLFRMGESIYLFYFIHLYLLSCPIFTVRSSLLSTWYFISHFTSFIAQQCFL